MRRRSAHPGALTRAWPPTIYRVHPCFLIIIIIIIIKSTLAEKRATSQDAQELPSAPEPEPAPEPAPEPEPAAEGSGAATPAQDSEASEPIPEISAEEAEVRAMYIPGLDVLRSRPSGSLSARYIQFASFGVPGA
eukprot:SAG31_NODE_572_length_13974_cov_28.935640_16_plen_135_part_00